MEKTPEAAAERRRYVRLLSTAAALAALGSGLFMASAHVQTIPGELLKLLSRHPPDPFGRRLQYRAAVVLPLAVE